MFPLLLNRNDIFTKHITILQYFWHTMLQQRIHRYPHRIFIIYFHVPKFWVFLLIAHLQFLFFRKPNQWTFNKCEFLYVWLSFLIKIDWINVLRRVVLFTAIVINADCNWLCFKPQFAKLLAFSLANSLDLYIYIFNTHFCQHKIQHFAKPPAIICIFGFVNIAWYAFWYIYIFKKLLSGN